MFRTFVVSKEIKNNLKIKNYEDYKIKHRDRKP